MKRVSQLTTALLLAGLSQVTFAAAMPTEMNLSSVKAENGAVIDTRPSAFYNGWPQALNLPASWLALMSDEQLSTWAKQHQLTKT